MWDPSLDPEDFIIGYEDRFTGVVEVAFKAYLRVEEYEGIPFHRVRYFKRKGHIVWDRRTRVDLLSSGLPLPDNDEPVENDAQGEEDRPNNAPVDVEAVVHESDDENRLTDEEARYDLPLDALEEKENVVHEDVSVRVPNAQSATSLHTDSSTPEQPLPQRQPRQRQRTNPEPEPVKPPSTDETTNMLSHHPDRPPCSRPTHVIPRQRASNVFLSVVLPDEICTQVQSLLPESAPALLPRSLLHVTLRFFGHLEMASLEKLKGVLSALKGFSFDFGVLAVRAFPDDERARMLWLQLNYPPALKALLDWIELGVSDLGLQYKEKERDTQMHVTLARLKPPRDLRPLIGSIPSLPHLSFKVETLHLMQSEGNRSEYRVLHSITLQENSV